VYTAIASAPAQPGARGLDRDHEHEHREQRGRELVETGSTDVVEEPLIQPGKIYGIDTGACHGGRLTAVILPGLRVCSVLARADHWDAS
jgi:serine/threonine protein phosphatase 1